ncbi:acetylxylan esterase [Pontibacter toksunensis]|uniref:Acetylxylan esterase n=1 Tax=Pontibacter toksunensis TaxID=1332631 RepID=A0ABW6C4F4_9BACT
MIKGLIVFLAFFLCFTTAQAQNYEESKVPAYTLPEVLKMEDGTAVRNKASWENKRRPEILRLFEDNVYGQMPKKHDSLSFTVTNEVPNAMDGMARLKEVTITAWKDKKSADIHLTLFIPTKPKKPVPAFLLINNRDQNNTDPTRATKSDFWPAEMVVDSGYAVAAFHVSDAAPDTKDSYQNGILRLYPEQLKADNGMKAIGAWAWAASRVMDYFEADKDIDARKVALVGHSRGGKAASWAGAQDQRFAIVISNNSGNTGAALSRRRFGETVKKINDTFPHWFNDNYKKYNDNEAALPVDQHMLLSLIAPRPVYVTSASEDLWADPRGSYISLLQAQKAYNLYKKPSALSPEPPAINSPIINSYLGYHNREGKHNLTAYDWQNFIQFADYHFTKQK